MPELPEVETVVSELNNHLKNEKIRAITFKYDVLRGITEKKFVSQVLNQGVENIERFGKYILICLTNQKVIRIHLRMEGKFFLMNDACSPDIDKHVHVVFMLESGKYLKYHDVRKFGTFELIDYYKNWHDELHFKALGYEPWEKKCTAAFLKQRAQKSKMMIKPFLLNQKTIVGLGNIYVDEVLFAVQIHPETRVNTLTQRQCEQIIHSAKNVMERAIFLGGSTIRTYHNTLGIDGRFQNELKVHLQKGALCQVCGQEIKKIKVAGRGTYYCPRCQLKKEG